MPNAKRITWSYVLEETEAIKMFRKPEIHFLRHQCRKHNWIWWRTAALLSLVEEPIHFSQSASASQFPLHEAHVSFSKCEKELIWWAVQTQSNAVQFLITHVCAFLVRVREREKRDRQIWRERERKRERDRQTDKQTDRQTDHNRVRILRRKMSQHGELVLTVPALSNSQHPNKHIISVLRFVITNAKTEEHTGFLIWRRLFHQTKQTEESSTEMYFHVSEQSCISLIFAVSFPRDKTILKNEGSLFLKEDRGNFGPNSFFSKSVSFERNHHWKQHSFEEISWTDRDQRGSSGWWCSKD